jgi:hypothetical protein
MIRPRLSIAERPPEHQARAAKRPRIEAVEDDGASTLAHRERCILLGLIKPAADQEGPTCRK